jgi:hypothetical protein
MNLSPRPKPYPINTTELWIILQYINRVDTIVYCQM